MKVLFSQFNNPFINLSIEDHFLRLGSELPVLFLYVNRPCVVLGRFQNPWIECNLPYLVSKDIWLVRRQSGGGCVYQDLGNLNFSFITSDPMVDRKKFAVILKAAFEKSGIHLTISPRNDLWLGDKTGTQKKISGSAYKQTKFGSFHHGTFLISSDLGALEESLGHTLVAKHTRSLASVRSKVITLQEMFPELQIKDVIEIMAREFNTKMEPLDHAIFLNSKVTAGSEFLRSWEWLWGETPSFDLETKNGDLNIHKGKLQNGEKFSRDSMKDHLSQTQWQNFFPDFSEQHRLSSRIL